MYLCKRNYIKHIIRYYKNINNILAHTLKDETQIVSEMYLTHGYVENSKYLLIVYFNGKVTLTWYLGDTRIPQKNVELVRYMNGMRVEYGQPNSQGIKGNIVLTNYNDGKLNSRWEKIK
jgi:hypothetical protein